MATSTSQASPTVVSQTTASTLVPSDAPAINAQPVELDASASVTPEEVRRRRGSEIRGGSEV
ncbi:hypothetical protein COCCADRAFT_108162 [Bipolaris zeicola 26-R-13]|uniref:Uncharacterized protein n=1 Tax=Cochliobolus carbonum (strain 26-R-13) TaxID=930089 RepID=W6XT56_COCC2|nr:uncharacterized protein COCCADRAFT_108162 [Bipolaris zeicola 26-R-13]EUC28818.1 hypothetical protein COCCADRAFT_108162 [Bipolaris zeicola 26-R-13]